MYRFLRTYLVIAMATVFMGLSLGSLLRKSPTCDEAAHHISSGYILLKKADFRFSTEVPPLPRDIMSLPLLFMDLKLPDRRSFWAREDRAEFSRNFLYDLNKGKVNEIFISARVMCLLAGLIGGFVLFFFTRKHYGPPVAFMAALFYFLSPNIIAHSRLATTDIVFTVTGMLSIFSFWEYLNDISYRSAFKAAVFTALALLSKFSAALLPVLYALIFFAMIILAPSGKFKSGGRWHSVKTFLVFGSAVFVILWGGYLFEFKPLLADVLRQKAKEDMFVNTFGKLFPFAGTAVKDKFVEFFYSVPVPLGSYILGLLGVLKHGQEGSRTFFLGAWSHKGNPFYYAVAFIIKTPVPVLISFFFGVFISLKERTKRNLNVYLLSISAVFFILASRSNLQLGLRYILIIYPVIFILSAVGMIRLLRGKTAVRSLAIVLILWFVAGNIMIWPDYLSYFNELIGGPGNGYKYLRDSNIDWGQDLPALKNVMTRNGIDTVKLAYFGEGKPALYGINYDKIGKNEHKTPGDHVYAISVQYLDYFDWTKNRPPDLRAGYSINIYDMRPKEHAETS